MAPSRVEKVPLETLPPGPFYGRKRTKYALRNRPSRDSFAAFGEPSKAVVEGPLGSLMVPIHSFCAVEASQEIR